jgi:hypothetical protein
VGFGADARSGGGVPTCRSQLRCDDRQIPNRHPVPASAPPPTADPSPYFEICFPNPLPQPPCRSAASASSWTLDLLANAELLAALTGLPLGHQDSSASFDAIGSAYSGTVYGGATPMSYTGTLAAALSAARTSGDGRPDGGVVGAGAAEMAQRLQSGDASAKHQVARAVLAAAARAGSSAHGGGTAAAAAAAVAAFRDSLDGRAGRGSGEVWSPRRIASVTAAESASLDMAARGAAAAPERNAASFNDPRVNQRVVSPFATASLGDAALMLAGGQARNRFGAQRALFADDRASLAGPGTGELGRFVSSNLAAGSSAAPAGAGPEVPLLLISGLRRGGDNGSLYGGPSCDVTYTSMHLSPSAQQLGVALPAETASRAAAAAAVAMASATATSPSAAALSRPSPRPPALVRRPSLALVNVDEQIAARRASLEESLHGGKLWARLPSGAAGASAGCISPVSISSSASSSHLNSGSLTELLTPGLLQELRTLSAAATAASAAPAAPAAAVMRTPPSLARITECSDLGDTVSGTAEGVAGLLAAAGAPGGGGPAPWLHDAVAQAGLLQPLPPTCGAQLQQQHHHPRRSPAGASGGVHASAGVAPPQAAAVAAAARWRSPFEELAEAEAEAEAVGPDGPSGKTHWATGDHPNRRA